MRTRSSSIAVGCFTAALLSWARVVTAQETVEHETIREKIAPSPGLLTSGIVTAGLAYGAAAYVSLTSDVRADRRMIVPLAGPWLALAGRPECGDATGRSCNAATTAKVLIIGDGVLQALGSLLVVEAFLNPATRTVTRTARPSVRIAPAHLGSAYGVTLTSLF